MHVGVFPERGKISPVKYRLPHARGGVSNGILFNYCIVVSSPCTWGCFRSHLCSRHPALVFPMHVGVFPDTVEITATGTCLPHARGGVSIKILSSPTPRRSSPCTWGCFNCKPPILRVFKVFPMHVGVFLKAINISAVHQGLPHARGGVSPHIWPVGIPGRSSPCTWGCFRMNDRVEIDWQVFPMHVGVFLSPILILFGVNCLPHARGGVSSSISFTRDT